MIEAALEGRVDSLEYYMKELSYQSMRTEMELARLAREMREFKNEMRGFKAETERDRKRMNAQWGKLANRLGTLAEDIVAPNLPRVARELFGCDTPELAGVRLARHRGPATFEVDVLVVCPRLVLLNETKSRLKSEHLDELVQKVVEFPDFYPEYRRERIFGVAASLNIDPSLIRRATHLGLLIMGMGEETMDVLNPEVAAPARASGSLS